MSKIGKIECPVCGLECGKSGLHRHIKSKHPEFDYEAWKFENQKSKILVKEEWKQSNGKYKCPYCNKEYSKKGISTHIWRTHGDGVNFDPNIGYKDGNRLAWNKGLTVDTSPIIKKQRDDLVEGLKNGRIIPHQLGKPLSAERKDKISKSMKKAHAERRAWNIGMSRWNNEPSYPEIFFEKIIKKEFKDKDFKQEYNVGIYSIDFAWPHIHKAIEIDGEQHYRFENVIERDKRKDKLLINNGWKVLRIRWKDMCNDTQHWINIAKKFIDN